MILGYLFYILVRHPIYGGIILFCAGLTIVSNSLDRAMLTFILSVVLNQKALLEESYLRKLYEQSYSDYSLGRCKLIPFIYWIVEPILHVFFHYNCLLLWPPKYENIWKCTGCEVCSVLSYTSRHTSSRTQGLHSYLVSAIQLSCVRYGIATSSHFFGRYLLLARSSSYK